MGYEIDFLQVGNGNGDAIGIRYGAGGIYGYTIHVVDGGFTDTGERLVGCVNDWYTPMGVIDHVVLSHADNDHACGLINVLENFQVGTLWMNRPWLYADLLIDSFHGNFTVEGLRQEIRSKHPYLVELEKIAIRKNTVIREAFQGAQIGAFTVVAPSFIRYLSLVPEFDKTPTSYATATSLLGGLYVEAKKAIKKYTENWGFETLSNDPAPTKASNESSVVQLGVLDGDRVLLTADAGPIALEEAYHYVFENNLMGRLEFFQIPHHGSRRNVTPRVLDMWLGPKVPAGTARVGHAYCSLGKDKHDYPRRRVSNACLRRGYEVFTTRNGDIRFSKNIAARSGYSALTSMAFENEFEE